MVPDRPISTRIDDRLDLARAMARLPEGQRRLLELKFLLGLTNAEVCALSHKSIVAIKAQQWRALRKLRELLKEDDENE
jgi:DNA-directed RNA polymerase specialized sigma24 family protein